MALQLEEYEAMHEQSVIALERKCVEHEDRYVSFVFTVAPELLCRRIKKEAVNHVDMVAGEFRRQTGFRMAETTKRALIENVAMSAELSKLSSTAVEMVDKQEKAKHRERDARFDQSQARRICSITIPGYSLSFWR